MHIFAYNAEMEEYNSKCLSSDSSPLNPVAKLCPIYNTQSAKSPRHYLSHFRDLSPVSTIYIAVNSKVELRGKNINPQFGLYNGASGIVVDIVFNNNQSPNTAHLPRYVLVRFHSYTGPAFLEHDPNIVPIVPITTMCSKKCCKRTTIPLQLCYATTIHKFQGRSAGPVSHGQPPNEHHRVVVHCGSRNFEAKHCGLTYTSMSRATSLGDLSDPSTSALFFDGPDAVPERFIDIGRSLRTNKIYYPVYLRTLWVQHLQSKRNNISYSQQEKHLLFTWAETFKADPPALQNFFTKFNSLH